MDRYLSVSQYAKLCGKDPGNIRRMLASGRLEGHKIGNQWVICENIPYPADRRETDGKYRNWRNKVAFNKNRELSNTVSKMSNRLCGIYGDLISEIVLYGSYARGTQTDESDVDIALMLNGKPTLAMTDAMIDCVASSELECGKVLSVIDIDSEKFNVWKDTLPFYKNIRKDGVILWKSAM